VDSFIRTLQSRSDDGNLTSTRRFLPASSSFLRVLHHDTLPSFPSSHSLSYSIISCFISSYLFTHLHSTYKCFFACFYHWRDLVSQREKCMRISSIASSRLFFESFRAYLTFCSSFSISNALRSSGPRTAYSILRRFIKTLSSVRTFRRSPVTDVLVAMPRYGMTGWRSDTGVIVRAGPPQHLLTVAMPTVPPRPARPPSPAELIVFCFHAVLAAVLVVVLVDQPPAITAFRKCVCDMILVKLF